MIKRTVKRYPEEFKKSSIQLAVEAGASLLEVSKNLKVSISTPISY